MNPALAPGRTADGVAYWTLARGSGSWLAVTHGSFGNYLDFAELLAPLADRLNLLFWDLPGHGDSRAIAPARRLTQAADALAAVMSAAGVPAAHQLGFSFGGMVAQCFARHHPARTLSLIAYACVPIMLARITSPRLANARTQREFARTPWLAFCETFSQQVSVRADLQEAFARKMAVQRPAVRDAIYEAMIFGMSLDPDFRYAMPVAQIRGGLDDRFPGAAPAMDALAATLPSELVEDIPGAGHLAHIEQPEAFLAALARLLSRLDGRRV